MQNVSDIFLPFFCAHLEEGIGFGGGVFNIRNFNFFSSHCREFKGYSKTALSLNLQTTVQKIKQFLHYYTFAKYFFKHF